ncbi:MAG TPA: ElyC/SanA/YdcF family protein [Polyangiaceae bacterium]
MGGWAIASATVLLQIGCTSHDATPARVPTDARAGHAPPGFDTTRACTHWSNAVGPEGSMARKHNSFPETDPAASCFVPVVYTDAGPRPQPIPAGCGYPAPDALATTLELISKRAERYERIAQGASEPLPLELACGLSDDALRTTARFNARTLRALAQRLPAHAPYPYAAVGTFGYGFGDQAKSALVPYRPGTASCPVVASSENALFDVNQARANRAAAAFAGGVAPVVIVSGGAVHSPLTEAFLLEYLLACRYGVPEDAVLLDPCADHTHTNMRNTGSMVIALGGRTAYLVTDDGLQSRYLEEWTLFNLVGGSIDQRSLRDFGYLLGSFRRASIGMGMNAGFWYTPYRFWAEPWSGLGSFTCIP